MQKSNLVLRHYNKLKPINCSVISGDANKLFTVELSNNEGKGLEMIKGDPVLIGRLNDDESLSITGGNVVGVTQQDDKYIIYANEIAFNINIERRQYERYPTSLLGEIKLQNSNKRESLCLKDLSYSGMCVYSTGDFNVEDNVEVCIFLNNSVAMYDGIVIRKAKNYGRNEYGIKIVHRDKNSISTAQAQLTSLVQSEKDIIYKHLLNSKLKL